jgi:hypothetical protein
MSALNPQILTKMYDVIPLEVTVTLMAERSFSEPVHDHWWQGWSWARIKEWAFDDIYVERDTYDDFWEEHVDHKLSPGPLSALLRPKNRVLRMIPVSRPQRASVRREGDALALGPIHFPAPLLVNGPIGHIRVATLDGQELWTTALTRTITVLDETKESVTISTAGLTLS